MLFSQNNFVAEFFSPQIFKAQKVINQNKIDLDDYVFLFVRLYCALFPKHQIIQN